MNYFYIYGTLGIKEEVQKAKSLEIKNEEDFIARARIDRNKERSKFWEMVNELSDADTVWIYDLRILASDLKELTTMLLALMEKNVTLRIINSGKVINFADEAGSAYIDTLKDCENFIQGISNEKRLKGIQKAKESGKYKGKKKIEVPDFAKHYKDYMSRKTSKPKLAKELKISRGTLDRLFREYEENMNKEKNIPTVPLQEGSKIGQLRFDDIDMSLKEER